MSHDQKIKQYWKWGMIVMVVIMVSFGFYIYHWEYRKPVLEIYFFSLNRGRAVFIRSPENKTILLGGGQTSETIRKITNVMPFYRRKLDYVMVPSAVPAQIGGLIEIIDRYEVGEIIIPKILATSTALTALRTKIRKLKIHVREVERGDQIDFDSQVKAEILFPILDFKFNKTSLPELSLSISYGSTFAYFVGNLSKTIQKSIAKEMATSSAQNIIEFYNTATESKVSSDFLEKIQPIFIFSTKEKTVHAVSSGEKWEITR